MSRYLHYETAPPMWGIEASAVPGGGAVLRVGQKRIAITAIRGITREEETERDVKGLITMGGWFIVGAVIFVMGVVEIGWRTRFLIGAFILGCLAFVSLTESLSINRIRFVRLRFATPEGDVVFTTPDHADADALLARVAAEQRAPSPSSRQTSLRAPTKSSISRAERQPEVRAPSNPPPEPHAGDTVLNSSAADPAIEANPLALELSVVSPEPKKRTDDSETPLRPLADGPAPHRERPDGGSKLSLSIEVRRQLPAAPR